MSCAISLWQSMHLKVGVLAPNTWHELQLPVPSRALCAFESGPGEICARDAEAPNRHAPSSNTASVSSRHAAVPASLHGAPLRTRSSVIQGGTLRFERARYFAYITNISLSRGLIAVRASSFRRVCLALHFAVLEPGACF